MIKNFTRSSLLLATAFGLALGAVPANAKNANIDSSERADVAAQTAAGGGSGTTKYCVVEKYTGSRLPVKVCKSERQWKKEGVSIDELNK
jgi:hypothetical protein